MKLQDCVIRALSLGLNIPYFNIVKMLNDNSKKYCCDSINIKCYEKLLEDLGYSKQKANSSIKHVALSHPNSTLIIRMNGHLTCSIKGCVYDIWDCTNEKADCYWIIN